VLKVQRSVTEARKIESLCTVSLQRKKRAPLLPMLGGLTANKSTRAVNAATHTPVSDFLPYFNSFLFMRAVLCSTDTRNLNPSNPGFARTQNRVYGFENRRVYPGFRVPGLHSLAAAVSVEAD